MTVLRLQSADAMQSESAADSELILCFEGVVQQHNAFFRLEDVLNRQVRWAQEEILQQEGQYVDVWKALATHVKTLSTHLQQEVKCVDLLNNLDKHLKDLPTSLHQDVQYLALLNSFSKYVKELATHLCAKEIKTSDGLLKEGALFKRLCAYVPNDFETFSLDWCTHKIDQVKEEFCQYCYPVFTTLLKKSKELASALRLLANSKECASTLPHARFDHLICVWDIFQHCLKEYRYLCQRQQRDCAKLQKFFTRSDLSSDNMTVIKSDDFFATVQDCATYADGKKIWIDERLSTCKEEQCKARKVRDGVPAIVTKS